MDIYRAENDSYTPVTHVRRISTGGDLVHCSRFFPRMSELKSVHIDGFQFPIPDDFKVRNQQWEPVIFYNRGKMVIEGPQLWPFELQLE